MTPNEIMRIALEEAHKAALRDEVPIGAVIVKDGEILAAHGNRTRELNDPTAHAEIVAIRKACKNLNTFNLSGCDIYTSCEPCPMCLSAIYWSRINNIYYANTREDAKKINFDDSMIYSEFSKKIEDRKIPIKQLLRDEALKAFEIWDKKKDKIEY